MASLYLCPDDFWRCPIDLNHRVLAKRFQYHIRRCMIANPHIGRVRCVFNANHLTTPKNLLNHMSTCPDAISTSTVLIGLADIPPGRPSFEGHHRPSEPTDWQMFNDVNATEDWDDDIRERRARSAAVSEQTPILPLLEVSTSSSSVTPPSQNNQKDVESRMYKLDLVDDKDRKMQKKIRKVVPVKKAHILEEYGNDGQVHPVEMDELTKNLMRIRTLQLIGGAGRGTCCLVGRNPPAPGSFINKSP